MKLQFTAIQDGTQLDLTCKVYSENKSKIAGSILNELFAWIKLQKEVNAKGLKLSEPINLKFEFGAHKFDTTKIAARLQQTLKLQNNAQGYKRFANKFWQIFNYVTDERKQITFEQLIENLEAEVIAESN